MKYRQLTKEQFESLHEEFARFLASQSIDVKEWNQIKEEKPQVAEEEMNVFSDVVWDDVLTRTAYVDHFSANMLNLFYCDEDKMKRIVVQVNKPDIDISGQEGYQWLLQHATAPEVEILQGSKKYHTERNVEVFDLIEKGGTISKGELFRYFEALIS